VVLKRIVSLVVGAGCSAVAVTAASVRPASAAPAPAVASTRPAAPRAIAPRAIAPRDIETALQIPSLRPRAIAAISGLMVEQPDAVGEYFSKWVKWLMDAEQYDLVDRAGLVAIVERPQVSNVVSDIQAARVEALLAQGKNDRALVEAKRYYNVVTLKQTDAAIDLLAAALGRASPAVLGSGKPEAGLATRFRQQQLAGAQKPSYDDRTGVPPYLNRVREPGESAAGDNVLHSIELDAAPFEKAIEKISSGTGYADLMGRGNLLLLSGRPTEAKQCFRRAAEAETTRGKNLIAALEGVARAIRAEDGAVGRANAFILALREEK
jgi:hypothetical protein